MNNRDRFLAILLGLVLGVAINAPFYIIGHNKKVRVKAMNDSTAKYNHLAVCSYKCGDNDSADYYIDRANYWIDSSNHIKGYNKLDSVKSPFKALLKKDTGVCHCTLGAISTVWTLPEECLKIDSVIGRHQVPHAQWFSRFNFDQLKVGRDKPAVIESDLSGNICYSCPSIICDPVYKDTLILAPLDTAINFIRIDSNTIFAKLPGIGWVRIIAYADSIWSGTDFGTLRLTPVDTLKM